MKCPHCDYEGEMHADYYEAVWQTVAVTDASDYDYTGVTGTYDDGSTEDECLRCPSCYTEVIVYGRFRFIPIELMAQVDQIIAVATEVD